MGRLLDSWSRKAQASSERRNAKAMLQPRAGELRVEDCERVVGEPVVWAVSAVRGPLEDVNELLVGGSGGFGLAIAVAVYAARGVGAIGRTVAGRPRKPKEKRELRGLAGTSHSIVELHVSGRQPVAVVATYERPAVVLTETNGYWQRLRIDDQELWVMSHLTKRILQHAATWRGQG